METNIAFWLEMQIVMIIEGNGTCQASGTNMAYKLYIVARGGEKFLNLFFKQWEQMKKQFELITQTAAAGLEAVVTNYESWLRLLWKMDESV